MSRVVLLKCSSYEFDEVKKTIEKGIGLLGGISKFARKDEKILLKVNLLSSATPEKCVTTHPAVFKAVAEIFKSAGSRVCYGDSPAFENPYNTAKKSGLVNIAEDLNIELADFKNGRETVFESGRQNKKFVIANGVLDCDGLISLPKMKTHALEKITGSVKNQFGCIPGLLKAEYHMKIQDPVDFGKMLLDLNQLIKPRLYIMDGIIAMEGNGPRGGKPKKMNVLLLSEDPIALDATVCRLIGLEPELVPTIKFGQEFGYGVHNEKDIEIIGDDINNFIDKDFDVDKSEIKPVAKKTGIFKAASDLLLNKPVIDGAKCVKCGVCVKVCPVEGKAVNWPNKDNTKPPVYDYSKCIRCFCCQELCPESAISVRRSILKKIFIRK
jgi:uncharacterized protein (DUF362 family)/NAD-dependent dihydropyrimidine dehydrogenase PreA subunit